MSDYKQHAAEVVTSKATYIASGGAVVFGMTANELAAIGGLIVAVIAMVANAGISFYFKHQHLQIAKAKAACTLAKSGCPDIGSGDD